MGFILFCLVAFALVAWVVFTQVAGRQQLVVHVPYPVETARSIVRGGFGPLWSSDVPGDGTDNFRPRLRYRPPVLSVDYRPTEDGGCDINIWASTWWSMYGGLVMQHATLMWRKRLYVARRLNRGQEADLAAGG